MREAGFTPARIETLYPGARVDRFFRFFLPDASRLRICYASLVLPYKGAQVLVQALSILHRAGIDFSAEIAGDAPDAAFLQQLQEMVAVQGMDRKVRFTGFLDRVGLAGLFNRSNVLVFPSQFPEPFGISQVEAMAAGLVVISSGTGGAKEIVRHDVDGLLFQPESAQDLADKLYSLTTQAGLMDRLQKKAQSRAVEFSVDNAVRKIEDLVHEMKNPPELELPPLFTAE
jgi:glycosyltransferase involved in cell wall biosynthesis